MEFQQRNHKMQSWEKINVQPQLILFQFKPNGNNTFVDFLIVIGPSYTETRLKNVNNKLGKDQKNSGLNLAPSFMEGENMDQLYHAFEKLPIKSADKNLK